MILFIIIVYRNCKLADLNMSAHKLLLRTVLFKASFLLQYPSPLTSTLPSSSRSCPYENKPLGE